MEQEKLTSLVLALQQSEEQAATDLYNAFHKDLYYYIFKTVNDSTLAEDLLQETFIEIFQMIGKLNEPAAFVSWSRQIAYHRCTAYFRKRREILADEDEDGHSVFDTIPEDRTEFIPDEALDKEDLKQTIHAMIATLPPDQRSALLLRYFDELSVKEIADIQGVSEGTVKSRLNYGRKAIQKSVEDYEKKNGIKLHCVGIIPLLLWLFREYAASNGIARGAGSATAAYTAASAASIAAEGTGAIANTIVEKESAAITENVSSNISQNSAANKSQNIFSNNKTFSKVETPYTTVRRFFLAIKEVTIMKKLIIIGLAALALLIGGVVLYSVLTPKYTTIAAEDTVNISFYGHNGYGTATLSGEYDWTDKMLSDSASELERLRVRTQFKNTVKYTLSDTENLSNGDTVYLTINADNDRLKEYGYFVEEKTVSFTVEGLEELVDFDPFKDLTVNVTGTAPYGTLQFDDRSDQLSGLRIDADKTDRLKNGDVVTFTVRSKDGSNIDEYWAEKGYSLTRTSIEYTVSGVNSYVQSLEEIPEEELAKMKDQSEDLITSSFEKSRPHDSSDCKVTNGKQLISVEYVGCYLFTLKDGFKVGGYNPACKIMLLYKLTATSSEGEFSYYYPTFFEKPMLMQGTDFSVNLADCYGPRNEFVKGNYTCTYTNILGVNDYHYSQKYTGYPDMETFINKNIAPYVEKYTYVTTVENASSDSADAA